MHRVSRSQAVTPEGTKCHDFAGDTVAAGPGRDLKLEHEAPHCQSQNSCSRRHRCFRSRMLRLLLESSISPRTTINNYNIWYMHICYRTLPISALHLIAGLAGSQSRHMPVIRSIGRPIILSPPTTYNIDVVETAQTNIVSAGPRRHGAVGCPGRSNHEPSHGRCRSGPGSRGH